MVLQHLSHESLLWAMQGGHAPSARQAASADEPGKVLIVDADPLASTRAQEQICHAGHSATCVPDARLAMQAISSFAPDLVLLAETLPDADGYATCAAIKRDPAIWHIPVIMLASKDVPAVRMRAIEAEADMFLCHPYDPNELEARIRVLLRAKRRIDRMEQAEDVIFALARAVEAKDAYTEGHLQRLALYARAIGEQLDMGARELDELCYGALLHDVGKVGVDESILRKVGPLSPDERSHMQQHPLIGERIVQPLRLGGAVAPIVRHHHERWDGQGYPDGLAGEAIPLGARIVAVADAFDAMTTQRPYNTILSFEEAMNRLIWDMGRAFDMQVVLAFVAWLNGGLHEYAVGV
ncbi:HD domain-containing protein [Chloroflexia bacterium SDU3-3]|nr:HD domain-containing protein [Chloroflexia bacterium SDU3-3]